MDAIYVLLMPLVQYNDRRQPSLSPAVLARWNRVLGYINRGPLKDAGDFYTVYVPYVHRYLCYGALGVAPNAPLDVVKKAYYRLARACHTGQGPSLDNFIIHLNLTPTLTHSRPLYPACNQPLPFTPAFAGLPFLDFQPEPWKPWP